MINRTVAMVLLGLSFTAVFGIGGMLFVLVPRFEKLFGERSVSGSRSAAAERLSDLSHFACTYWFVVLPLFLLVYGGAFYLVWKGIYWRTVAVVSLVLSGLALWYLVRIFPALFGA